jgi:acetyl-CoA carboxylase biotin carboxyl carrier protein
MVNEAKLKRLLELFQQSDIAELELQHSFWRGTRVKISRNLATTPPADAAPELKAAAPAAQPPLAPPAVSEAGEEAPPSAPEIDDDATMVTSPMVGTFFRASSPEAEPFVSRGDHVRVGQTVCIIEAMKIMNEVQADQSGEVVEILAADGDPLEYGQPLIRLRNS